MVILVIRVEDFSCGLVDSEGDPPVAGDEVFQAQGIPKDLLMEIERGFIPKGPGTREALHIGSEARKIELAGIE